VVLRRVEAECVEAVLELAPGQRRDAAYNPIMSIFATLHATEPLHPRDALAFPATAIPQRPPFTVTVAGLQATALTPSKPNFLAADLGFDPAISLHLTLDKTALDAARTQLARAVRAFLRGSRGDLVALYIDTPVLKARRDGCVGQARVRGSGCSGGFEVVDQVRIPRAEGA
jgi:hypothetical protein